MWPRVYGLRAMELGSPGRIRDELNALSLSGQKHASAGLLQEYENEDEALETVGERLALLDNAGEAIATIEITGVSVLPFVKVPWAFADAEGEGFISIEDWRETHRRYWLAAEAFVVASDTPIVCLRYQVITESDIAPI